MKVLTLLAGVLATLSGTCLAQQSYHFNLTNKNKQAEYISITPDDCYTDSIGYGYDLLNAPSKKGKEPFFFSVKVPDGNYRVTVRLGDKNRAAHTTVRAESRRLFLENIETRKGETKEYSFVA